MLHRSLYHQVDDGISGDFTDVYRTAIVCWLLNLCWKQSGRSFSSIISKKNSEIRTLLVCCSYPHLTTEICQQNNVNMRSLSLVFTG